MAVVARVIAQDTGQDLAELFNAEAAHVGVPAELLVALAIAETELCVSAERWGRHTVAARAALAADDRAALAALLATIEAETPGDVSFGLFQQTVRWADEGDHTGSLENIFAIRELYEDPRHATAVAARKLGVYWRKYGDPLEALCRYNKPSLPGSQSPHRQRYRESLERARAYIAQGQEEHAMSVDMEVKLSPNFSANRRRTDGIIIHSTRGNSANPETDYHATINWFLNPQSEVSAHVVVGPRKVCRMVNDADVAWHAGQHNGTHLGMEIAQPRPDTPYTDFQYAAAAAVALAWCAKYNIPIKHVKDEKQPGIIGHQETRQGKGAGKTDPGAPFDWKRFIGLMIEPDPMLKRIGEIRLSLQYATGTVADRFQEALDGARVADTDEEREPAHDALQAALNTSREQRLTDPEAAALSPHAPDVIIPIQHVTGHVADQLESALRSARDAHSDSERATAYDALQAAINELRRHH
jgi:N-acetyl-anhydromuramyl-L-alanine amidase AmpD